MKQPTRKMDETGLTHDEKAAVDEWLNHLGDNVPAVESKVNLLNLRDLFASVDLTPFDNDLLGLANSIAECWRGLLAVRYPQRRFNVEVYDLEDGPELTFYSATQEPANERTQLRPTKSASHPARVHHPLRNPSNA